MVILQMPAKLGDKPIAAGCKLCKKGKRHFHLANRDTGEVLTFRDKAAWRRACESWRRANPTEIVTHFDPGLMYGLDVGPGVYNELPLIQQGRN